MLYTRAGRIELCQTDDYSVSYIMIYNNEGLPLAAIQRLNKKKVVIANYEKPPKWVASYLFSTFRFALLEYMTDATEDEIWCADEADRLLGPRDSIK